MKGLLQLVTVAALLISIGSCAFAKSSIHEIQGLIWALIATVGLVGTSILEFMHRVVDTAATEKRRIAATLRRCPSCGEDCRIEATACSHCGHPLPPPPVPKPYAQRTMWEKIFG